MQDKTPPFRPITPINVIKDAEAAKADFIVCYRVNGSETGPITRHVAATRLIKPCCRCGEDLYVSPVSPKNIPVICRPCVELALGASLSDNPVPMVRSATMEAEAAAATLEYLRDKGKAT